jgi:L-seryl-tRNA(Ser) seleniumtransferase
VIAVAHDQQIPTIEYLESATFFEIEGSAAAQSLPLVKDALARGADVVLLPGDAFLGGPRCGILLGREKYISQIAKDGLAQASVLDASRRAALLATLQCASNAECRGSVPLIQLLLATPENLQQRAERLAVQLRECSTVLAAEVIPNTVGYLNDAQLPDQQIVGSSVRVTPKTGSAHQLAMALSEQRPGIAARLVDQGLELALHSVLPRQDEQIVAAFRARSLQNPPQ